jgi:hypothetical protein
MYLEMPFAKPFDRNLMMALNVLLSPKSNTGKRLRCIIEPMHLKLRVEYHETLADLIGTLKQIGNRWGIAVIQVADRDELDALVGVREWLKDLRIILVLPDHRRDTISKGHLLYPRFVALADGELNHVGEVLEKMIPLKRSPP